MAQKTYTEQEIEAMKKEIDQLGQFEMARLWRFAPSGHPYFRNDLPLFDHFNARYKDLGGMTPEISKALGFKAP